MALFRGHAHLVGPVLESDVSFVARLASETTNPRRWGDRKTGSLVSSSVDEIEDYYGVASTGSYVCLKRLKKSSHTVNYFALDSGASFSLPYGLIGSTGCDGLRWASDPGWAVRIGERSRTYFR